MLGAYIKQFLGATEFLNNIKRYCFWLKGATPSVLRQSKIIKERIENVRNFRLASTKATTRKKADTPYLFDEIRQPESGSYLLVPRHSSENRAYIPLGYIPADVICGDANFIIPSATLYHFGVLTSSVHMAWMRVVAGRLKSDYRYSANIVYNNFPWPECESDLNHAEHVDHVEGCESGYLAPSSQSGEGETSRTSRTSREAKSEAGKNLHVSACSTRLKNIPATLCGSLRSLRQKIETSAQAILDARALYSDSSLADLYDPLTMPPELRKAHAANDRAVLAAYGLAPDTPEPEIVSHLMKLYQNLTAKEG